jgi:hypothetical protein
MLNLAKETIRHFWRRKKQKKRWRGMIQLFVCLFGIKHVTRCAGCWITGAYLESLLLLVGIDDQRLMLLKDSAVGCLSTKLVACGSTCSASVNPLAGQRRNSSILACHNPLNQKFNFGPETSWCPTRSIQAAAAVSCDALDVYILHHLLIIAARGYSFKRLLIADQYNSRTSLTAAWPVTKWRNLSIKACS